MDGKIYKGGAGNTIREICFTSERVKEVRGR